MVIFPLFWRLFVSTKCHFSLCYFFSWSFKMMCHILEFNFCFSLTKCCIVTECRRQTRITSQQNCRIGILNIVWNILPCFSHFPLHVSDLKMYNTLLCCCYNFTESIGMSPELKPLPYQCITLSFPSTSSQYLPDLVWCYVLSWHNKLLSICWDCIYIACM